MVKTSIFWFRRDLRLADNHGLYNALKESTKVIPVFIFDKHILDKLKNPRDKRVDFIHRQLHELNSILNENGSQFVIFHDDPLSAWKKILNLYKVDEVYVNHDYEPYACERDNKISGFLSSNGIKFRSFKDQVIFEKSEVLKNDGDPYVVYTPYSKKFRSNLQSQNLYEYPSQLYLKKFHSIPPGKIISLKELGFEQCDMDIPSRKIDTEILKNYDQTRNFPALNGTSRLGVHLRFGTISIRRLFKKALDTNDTYLNELIWREFYQQILWHFPYVVDGPFRKEYSRVKWIDDRDNFYRWCEGKTGYPLVDAGMRQLNETGYMHNRVRMVTASFLTKHLLINWQKGEQYFAENLLDFELASNNGGWQWAAGCGCDAAPYFRIFNPASQQMKFDPDFKYIKKWVTEFGTDLYPDPIVNHKFAVNRAKAVYQTALKN